MMVQKQHLVLNRYKDFFVTLLVILLFSFIIIFIGLLNVFPALTFLKNEKIVYYKINLDNVFDIPRVVVPTDVKIPVERNAHCTYYDCFDVYKCGHEGTAKISVYVYPLKEFVDNKSNPVAQLSREFYNVLQTVVNSHYYVANPEEACIFMPSIDTLNQNRFRSKETAQALAMLPM